MKQNGVYANGSAGPFIRQTSAPKKEPPGVAQGNASPRFGTARAPARGTADQAVSAAGAAGSTVTR